jgi:O-antigen/teichoic acid export membrane protein
VAEEKPTYPQTQPGNYLESAPLSQIGGGNTPLRQVFRGSGWYGLAIVLNRFIPGILTVVLAWWLEQSELGVLSFILAYYGVLSLVADWSIAYALQKLIPENGERAGDIAWTALFVRLGLSTALGIGCWCLDHLFGIFHGYGLYLALLLIASAFGTIVYVHNARCSFAKGSLFSIAFYLVWLPLALILVKVGMRITGPPIALCISFAVIGIPGFLLSPALRGHVTFVRPIALEILRFGAWATLATLLSGLADQVGILVVAYRVNDASAGIFRVATTFGVLPALLGMIVVLPLMPIAKRGMLVGDDVSVRLVLPTLRYLLMFGLAIAAAGFVLSPAVIRTFVGKSYMGAVWPLRVLLGASLLRMLVTALSGILFVGQGLKALARIHGTVAVIGLAGSLLVVREWGSTGVAVALLAGWTAGIVLLHRWFRIKASLPLEWSKYLRYAGSAAIMAAAVFLAASLINPPIQQFVLGGCVAVIVYALLLWTQRDVAFQGLINTVRNWAAQ